MQISSKIHRYGILKRIYNNIVRSEKMFRNFDSRLCRCKSDYVKEAFLAEACGDYVSLNNFDTIVIIKSENSVNIAKTI